MNQDDQRDLSDVDKLALAILGAATRLGIARPNCSPTGPQLLLLLSDIEAMARGREEIISGLGEEQTTGCQLLEDPVSGVPEACTGGKTEMLSMPAGSRCEVCRSELEEHEGLWQCMNIFCPRS